MFYSGQFILQETAKALPASVNNDLGNQFILNDSGTHFNFAAEHLLDPTQVSEKPYMSGRSSSYPQ